MPGGKPDSHGGKKVCKHLYMNPLSRMRIFNPLQICICWPQLSCCRLRHYLDYSSYRLFFEEKTVFSNCSIKPALEQFRLMSPQACTRNVKVIPVVNILKSIHNCVHLSEITLYSSTFQLSVVSCNTFVHQLNLNKVSIFA